MVIMFCKFKSLDDVKAMQISYDRLQLKKMTKLMVGGQFSTLFPGHLVSFLSSGPARKVHENKKSKIVTKQKNHKQGIKKQSQNVQLFLD